MKRFKTIEEFREVSTALRAAVKDVGRAREICMFIRSRRPKTEEGKLSKIEQKGCARHLLRACEDVRRLLAERCCDVQRITNIPLLRQILKDVLDYLQENRDEIYGPLPYLCSPTTLRDEISKLVLLQRRSLRGRLGRKLQEKPS